MSNDYSKLADQIGSVGDEQPGANEAAGVTGLGKIEHKEILGQQADLTREEEQSMEDFMKGLSEDRASRKERQLIGDGWIKIDRAEMGVRSDFYPKDWDFYVKPANVTAIKNWTSVNEEDTRAVHQVLNEIIRTSVKVDGGDKPTGGWRSINSWDRFWFVLKVREVTFVKGESKVEFDDQCSECGYPLTFELKSQALHYTFPDDELIDQYWDGKCWNIDPSEYDVDHEPIKLYVPTLGADERIIDWATMQANAKQTIDENFVRYLMWMLPNPSRDDNVLIRQIDKIYKEYKGWSIEMFGFMDDVITNLTVDPSETLRQKCESCGQEATSTVRFPDGIKVLFHVGRTAKKFGSR